MKRYFRFPIVHRCFDQQRLSRVPAITAAANAFRVVSMLIVLLAPAHAAREYPDAPSWWPEPPTGRIRIQTTMTPDGLDTDLENCVTAAEQDGAAAFVQGAGKLLGLFSGKCDVRWEQDGNTGRRIETCKKRTTVHEASRASPSLYTQTITDTENGQVTSQLKQRITRLGDC